MQIPLAGLGVLLPDRVLLVGKDDLVGGVRRLRVAPHVPVAVRVVGALAGLLEPGVLIGGVVDDQVADDAHAAVVRRAQHLDHVAQSAQARVDVVVVGDVVAVVRIGRGIERHQPQAGHTELGQIVDAVRQALQVTDPVAVAVLKRLHIQAVYDGVLPPQVTRVGDAHGLFSLVEIRARARAWGCVFALFSAGGAGRARRRRRSRGSGSGRRSAGRPGRSRRGRPSP